MPKLTWFLVLVPALSVLASTAALTADNFDDEATRGAGALAMPSLEVSSTPSVRVPSAPVEQPGGPARRGNPLWEIAFEILSGTRERPVFSPSRRPPPVAVTEVAVAKPPPPKPAQEERPPQLLLVGTITGDDRSFGIFVDQTSKAALRLRTRRRLSGLEIARGAGTRGDVRARPADHRPEFSGARHGCADGAARRSRGCGVADRRTQATACPSLADGAIFFSG